MNPESLVRWEIILRSQFAISLLLLGALLGVIGWCVLLYRENQRLNAEFREHLRIQGDFRAVMDNAREAIELVRGNQEGDRVEDHPSTL